MYCKKERKKRGSGIIRSYKRILSLKLNVMEEHFFFILDNKPNLPKIEKTPMKYRGF